MTDSNVGIEELSKKKVTLSDTFTAKVNKVDAELEALNERMNALKKVRKQAAAAVAEAKRKERNHKLILLGVSAENALGLDFDPVLLLGYLESVKERLLNLSPDELRRYREDGELIVAMKQEERKNKKTRA